MSRIGQKPITLPKGVDAKINGNEITVKGPKGELRWQFSPDLTVYMQDGGIIVKRASDAKQLRALHSTTRSIIANMVKGVSDGYERVLGITGTGYRAGVEGRRLILSLGYSHPVEYLLPEGITAEVDSRQTQITLKGIDKQLIGQVAADLRALKPPDVYKGKGIRYADEKIKLKAGKAGKK